MVKVERLRFLERNEGKRERERERKNRRENVICGEDREKSDGDENR